MCHAEAGCWKLTCQSLDSISIAVCHAACYSIFRIHFSGSFPHGDIDRIYSVSCRWQCKVSVTAFRCFERCCSCLVRCKRNRVTHRCRRTKSRNYYFFISNNSCAALVLEMFVAYITCIVCNITVFIFGRRYSRCIDHIMRMCSFHKQSKCAGVCFAAESCLNVISRSRSAVVGHYEVIAVTISCFFKEFILQIDWSKYWACSICWPDYILAVFVCGKFNRCIRSRLIDCNRWSLEQLKLLTVRIYRRPCRLLILFQFYRYISCLSAFIEHASEQLQINRSVISMYPCLIRFIASWVSVTKFLAARIEYSEMHTFSIIWWSQYQTQIIWRWIDLISYYFTFCKSVMTLDIVLSQYFRIIRKFCKTIIVYIYSHVVRSVNSIIRIRSTLELNVDFFSLCITAFCRIAWILSFFSV